MTQKKRSNPKSNPVNSKIKQRIDSAETLISSGDSEQRISALIKENAKIVQKYATAKAELVTAYHLIATLTEELKTHRRSPTLNQEELMNELAPLIIQEIKNLGGWEVYCAHHVAKRSVNGAPHAVIGRMLLTRISRSMTALGHRGAGHHCRIAGGIQVLC